ncbi:MAG: hypothetical protein JNN05_06105 [Candidatus Omnitrophica bacterium]|nr:hypothetical protein [Candidatus Omnitrophota bacterium]
MNLENPLDKSKLDYQSTIERIKSEGAVGIDAQYTHAIIIEYLQQISQRLDVLERKLAER